MKEDSSLRTKYGTERWNRAPSDEAAKSLREQGDRLGVFLKKAEESDGMVRSKLLEWEDIITLLSGDKVAPLLDRADFRKKWIRLSQMHSGQSYPQKVLRQVKKYERH